MSEEEKEIRYCEWCPKPLPRSERYHLRICPKCREESLDAILSGNDWMPPKYRNPITVSR